MKNEENPDRIISELDEIRGIGVWTAELTMLRGMQKLDALPADDFGIRRVISRYYCDSRNRSRRLKRVKSLKDGVNGEV